MNVSDIYYNYCILGDSTQIYGAECGYSYVLLENDVLEMYLPQTLDIKYCLHQELT